MTGPCLVCGSPDDGSRPICWSNTRFCCGQHHDRWHDEQDHKAQARQPKMVATPRLNGKAKGGS